MSPRWRGEVLARFPRTQRTAFVLGSLVLVATVASGQQEDLPAVFSEVIDVRVVNIEVVVTDCQGNLVRGLEPSDFELLVDGEPTPIDYFTEIADGLAQEGGSEVAGVPNLDANAHVPTNYLIYIDDLFSIENDRNLVLKHLEEDLGQLHSEDRMAAVAFDGARMETLTTWTNSPETLAEALERARSRGTNGLHRMSEASMARNDRDLKAALATAWRCPQTKCTVPWCRPPISRASRSIRWKYRVADDPSHPATDRPCTGSLVRPVASP